MVRAPCRFPNKRAAPSARCRDHDSPGSPAIARLFSANQAIFADGMVVAVSPSKMSPPRTSGAVMQQQPIEVKGDGKLEQVLQQVADHKGCGTSGGSGKASCGSGAGQNDLAPEIWEKVKNHPCYSEEAHHHYARMHVAVAPACNIQCNYCNRK